MGKKKKHCQSVEKIVSQAIWQLCRCCDYASSGPRLATGIAVLNRFNGIPTIHLPLVVWYLALIVLAVAIYSKNLKTKGDDKEKRKEKE